ncbi:MAG: hypothetical protein ACLTL8_05940 [Bifidobacterium pseudocatenulatum]
MSTVLAFGTYSVRKHPRVGILIDGLRKNGCNVEEINQLLLLSTAQRVEILKTMESIRIRLEFASSLEITQQTSTVHGRRRTASRMPCWSVIWGISTYYSPNHVFKRRADYSRSSHFCRRYQSERSWSSSGPKVKLPKRLDRMAINGQHRSWYWMAKESIRPCSSLKIKAW